MSRTVPASQCASSAPAAPTGAARPTTANCAGTPASWPTGRSYSTLPPRRWTWFRKGCIRRHYDPAAALKLGVRRAYVGATWTDRAREDFRKASEREGIPAPEIIPVGLGQTVEEEGLKVTALPANHASNFVEEETLIYLIEKDSTRLLYATDTGGLTARAAGYAGIGQFSRSRKFLTGIIMEATMGLDYQPDFRMFSHSSVAVVQDTVKVLSANRRYIPVEGQKVWLTHLAKVYHTSQAELDRTIPDPLKFAYDGLEILIR